MSALCFRFRSSRSVFESIMGQARGRHRPVELGSYSMAAPLALILGFAFVSLAVAPEQAAAPERTKITQKAQQEGNDWKFTSGKRRRKGSQNNMRAPLPERALSRAPIAAAGGYQGLRLESKTQPPMTVPADPDGGPVLSWVGFQRNRSQQGVVFVQVDRPVEHSAELKKGRLELSLRGVKVTHKNHARTLDLRYFPQTRAKKVRTKQRKDGITVTVELRGKVTPQVSTRPGPGGQHQILIVIP